MADKSDRASTSSSRKPLKFSPKIPQRKKSKSVTPKKELPDEENNLIGPRDFEIIQSHGRLGKRVSEVPEKKKLQVAFGPEDRSVLRSFGRPRESVESADTSPKVDINESIYDAMDASNEEPSVLRKQESEPWDSKYYPVRLPLNYPNSSRQGSSDEGELGVLSTPLQATDSTNPAKELDLLERDKEKRLLFFQFPTSLPLKKNSSKSGVKKGFPSTTGALDEGCTLNELPAGSVGKLLVFKSGAVKLKIGDILFDVSAGEQNGCHQELTAINTKEKQCCELAEIRKRAVVAADTDSILDSILKSG